MANKAGKLKTYGFLVYVTALNALDQEDIHNILKEGFKADLWSDVSNFKVGPLGPVQVSQEEWKRDEPNDDNDD